MGMLLLRRRYVNPKVNLARYPDDFIITGESRELLEMQVKPMMEAFMTERGLTLSPEKTVITNICDGFDFLGFNIRRYPNGKFLMQEFLLQLGYSLPRYGADGDFGSDIHKALMDTVADHNAGKEPAEPDESSEPSAVKLVRIVCSNGSVNIRVGNGTHYERITAARDGFTFERELPQKTAGTPSWRAAALAGLPESTQNMYGIQS